MISWIQTIIQRHHKWFFGGLLIVIIVAFVFTIGAVPGIGNPNRSEYTRDFWALTSPPNRSSKTSPEASR